MEVEKPVTFYLCSPSFQSKRRLMGGVSAFLGLPFIRSTKNWVIHKVSKKRSLINVQIN